MIWHLLDYFAVIVYYNCVKSYQRIFNWSSWLMYLYIMCIFLKFITVNSLNNWQWNIFKNVCRILRIHIPAKIFMKYSTIIYIYVSTVTIICLCYEWSAMVCVSWELASWSKEVRIKSNCHKNKLKTRAYFFNTLYFLVL